ncbi:MAG TPA: hypothetical protein VIO11_01770 [Candidatus Methanoperedens sp.]
MDSDGNIEWIRKFEKTTLEGAFVVQSLDSGYLLVTSRVYENGTDFDVWLIKLDSEGNEQWDRTLRGGKSWDLIHSVQLTSDGYILAGNTGSYGSSDVLLMKTDTNGNVLWSKTFAGINSGGFHSVQKTLDGGYILAGYTGADLGSDLMDSYYGDGWLVKVDSNGTKQWDMIFEDYRGMFFNSARQTQDGGYIIAGCCGKLTKFKGDNRSHPAAISTTRLNKSGEKTPASSNSSQRTLSSDISIEINQSNTIPITKRPTEKPVPSFELLEVILAVIFLFLLKRKRINKGGD